MTIQVVKVTVSVPSELVKMADKVAKKEKPAAVKWFLHVWKNWRSRDSRQSLRKDIGQWLKRKKHLAEETFDAQREVLPEW